ncbi:MAG: DUF2863 family protein [Pseudomonadota bacterium]|nr:DUF2863 family protein [Pseudomonadota bacterium]MDP1903690.1 DUF2863 family protein [Pseudomonadota bacterium]MDP2354389.1 DUF2863 family protein [Pseudomonadota bacterium]
MKRRRRYARPRLSRDAERLAWLAQALADSGSRLEDTWLESEMTTLIEKLLRGDDEDALNQALDRLHDTNSRAYDDLADLIEAACEINRENDTWRMILAMPVLAWSRYTIPTRTLPQATLDGLRAQLSGHILAADAKVHLANYLFSPDQLPQGYCDTRAFADALFASAGAGQDLIIEGDSLPESQTFVSDVRYLLAVVQVPANHPVFRWNEADGDRDGALEAWRAQAGANLQPLLTGCAHELLLPDAYFSAWRRADRETRPFALRAAVEYLKSLFNVPASRLRAVAAPYYDRWLEEWRIGFTGIDSDDVVHGVTWPLLGGEDESADLSASIETLLKETGLGEVRMLDTRMPLEYCDDCGAPLFPNPEGESVHAQLPEEMQGTPTHLH